MLQVLEQIDKTNKSTVEVEAAITEAITQMQIFGGLHPSGQLDEDTLKVTTTL